MLGTRAVVRKVEPGGWNICVHCRKRIMYSAKEKKEKVIANVYKDGKWSQIEQFHFPVCYVMAGQPHGEPQ